MGVKKQPLFLRTHLYILMGGAIALNILFNNCSKKTIDFVEKPSNIDVFKNSDGTDPDAVFSEPTYLDPVEVEKKTEELVRICAEAKASGKLIKEVKDVNFEDPVGSCPWNKSDNLSKKNEFVRARIEQIRSFNTLDGSAICDLELENYEEQNFWYDDNLILTLNGRILASTSNFNSHFEKIDGVAIYNWMAIRDQDAQNQASDTTLEKQYCLGESQGLASCSFPETQKTGKVVAKFSDEVIQSVLGMTSSSLLNLKLVTTGDDNESTDCHHVPIKLKATFYYVGK